MSDVQLTFLTIPLDIRFQFYDLLLVSRYDRKGLTCWMPGDENQKFISMDVSFDPPIYRSITPAILQTCRKVYHEAKVVMYSQNVFLFDQRLTATCFCKQIGVTNLGLLRRIHLWVQQEDDVDAWLALLDILARKATNLTFMELGWHGERGLGDNLDFVRLLSKLRVHELVVKGYYAKNWPLYLEKTTRARVRAIPGLPPRELGERHPLDNDTPDILKDIEISNAEKLQSFRRYQEGTETLFP